ncbi:uncharacterized protein LOC129590163 isoform X2 [Paramacrobiotus metropolitanus]|uniref:uncharacterized protein LOC129590163 isoform X2 n=1 Tax=Paramacrobiotus metropolitanus TaxID=2943436 RepID=UPI002445F4CB|nr:uncharacterized protein LOC129590163 isoform X2 [Paramacrobiotus metropolitanus]
MRAEGVRWTNTMDATAVIRCRPHRPLGRAKVVITIMNIIQHLTIRRVAASGLAVWIIWTTMMQPLAIVVGAKTQSVVIFTAAQLRLCHLVVMQVTTRRHHSFEDELNMDIEESQRHQHGGCGDENCGCQKKRKRSGCAKKKPPCPKKKKSACPKKKAKKVNECKKADPCKSKTKVDKCDKCQKPKPKCGCKPKKDKCSKSDICEHGRPAEDPCSKCHKPASDGCHKLKEDKCSKPGKPDPCGHRPKQSAKPACECQNDCCANHKEEKHCNHQ